MPKMQFDNNVANSVTIDAAKGLVMQVYPKRFNQSKSLSSLSQLTDYILFTFLPYVDFVDTMGIYVSQAHLGLHLFFSSLLVTMYKWPWNFFSSTFALS